MNDSDLIRLLDGEAAETDRLRARAHLQTCDSCTAQLERLRRRSVQLDSLFRELDTVEPEAVLPRSLPAVHRSRFGGTAQRPAAAIPMWRAAAAIVLLLGMAAAASPLRALASEWIARQWAEITAWVAGPDPAPSPAEPALGNAVAPAEVQFVPEGNELLVEFQSPQQNGSVILTAEDGPYVRITATSGEPSAAVVVLPEGMRIRNSPGSSATYRVTVPSSLRGVQIRLGAGRVIAIPREALASGAEQRISLRRAP